jgi:proteasome lid subunit RPN8/RPN11
MSKNQKRLPLIFHAEVLQRIRQHARSSMEAEICGVLIGLIRDGQVVVNASIEGEHATSGGAHVTFTQETWEHIYRTKDRQFPHQKIIGWYHSHPGFGIFLSEYDTFIHENFFSAPHQVAWVYDPHSDEEGCFAWDKGKLKRLKTITVVNPKADQDEKPRPEPDPASLRDGTSSQSGLGRLVAGCRKFFMRFGWSRRPESANQELDPETTPATSAAPDESPRAGGPTSDDKPKPATSKLAE